MGVLDFLGRLYGQPTSEPEAARAYGGLSFSEYLNLVEYAFNGNTYVGYASTMSSQEQESIDNNFSAYVQGIYKRDGIVSACIVARALVFSEIEFAFRNRTDKTLSPLPPRSRILEQPDVNMTQGELLWRMEQDISLAGNWYGLRRPGRIRRLRPDWVDIILDSTPDDPDVNVIGYSYKPPNRDARLFTPPEIAHWSPEPDPEASFRGMSWVTSVLTEVQSDMAAENHKYQFYLNAATPNLVVTAPDSVTSDEKFTTFKQAIDEDQTGRFNHYKTMYLASGASVTAVGSDLKQLDFKATQGAGETRIASRARVPAVILGISEGLAGSSLNAGNYGMARRQFADGFLRPHWRSACAALSSLITVPDGQQLWYDEGHVAFLREDEKDAAEITQIQAAALRQLVDGGFDPTSAIDAVNSGDLRMLEHTGSLSVQLHPEGIVEETPPELPPATEPTPDEGDEE